MSRRFTLLLAMLLLIPSAHAAVSSQIYAYFDVDGGLQFRYADSSNVGNAIPPGSYTINLNNNGADDLGNDHIFRISGPGVDYTAPNVNTQATFNVTFQSGATYVVSDNLDPKVRQSILATATQSQTPGTTGPTAPVTGSKTPKSSDIVGSDAPLPFRGSLDAIVYSSGKLSLTRNGKKVSSLRTGRYTFAVDDESKKKGFSVQVLHGKAQAVTTTSFVGNHDKTISLKAGRWTFFSPGGTKSTFYVVS